MKDSSERKQPHFGSVRQLLYFLFVPTFVYQHEYKRTNSIRWTRVCSYAFQILLSLLTVQAVFYYDLVPTFQQLATSRQQPVQLSAFLHFVRNIGIFSPIFHSLGFYIGFHCGLNLISELLCFADRTGFYDAWWLCTNLPSFYRKWNSTVYKWIHVYLYNWLLKVRALCW